MAFTALTGQIKSAAAALSAGALSNAANASFSLSVTPSGSALALEGDIQSVAAALNAGALSNTANIPLYAT